MAPMSGIRFGLSSVPRPMAFMSGAGGKSPEIATAIASMCSCRAQEVSPEITSMRPCRAQALSTEQKMCTMMEQWDSYAPVGTMTDDEFGTMMWMMEMMTTLLKTMVLMMIMMTIMMLMMTIMMMENR